MFIDYAKLKIIAGRGGDGCVSFAREIYRPKGGPNGGNGGGGGSVYFTGNRNLDTLADFSSNYLIKAPSGGHGLGSNKTGKTAVDIYLKVPLGTLIKDGKGALIGEVLFEGQNIKAAEGGEGGKGNAYFKTSRNTAPKRYTKGLPGEEKEIVLELKLMADIGIIGLPNSGKSTLLSALTNAKPKIAPYAFTTINPKIGRLTTLKHKFLICDIPGLIVDAHKGKGLGIKFLKHIDRCRVLVHLIDASAENIKDSKELINSELKYFSPHLALKKQILAINKIDNLSESELQKLRKKYKNFIFISALEKINLDELKEKIDSVFDKLKDSEPLSKKEDEVKKIIFQKDKISVEKRSNVFYVKSKELEKLVLMTDFENKEAYEYFKFIAKKKKFDEILRDHGATAGSAVNVAGLEFIFEG